MKGTDCTARKPPPAPNDRTSGHDREHERHHPAGGDLVFYVAITIVAVILCVIFWVLFSAP